MKGLYDDDGSFRIVRVALIVLAIAIGISFVVIRIVSPAKTAESEARALREQGKLGEAEAAWAVLVRKEPTVPHVLALLDAHREAKLGEQALGESDLDAVLRGLPPDVALLARFDRGDPLVRSEVEDGAKREPPLAWANHVLARRALPTDAPDLYLREGLSSPDRRFDVEKAISMWIVFDDWPRVRIAMNDVRIASSLQPRTQYEIAAHEGDFSPAVRALFRLLVSEASARTLWLAAIAAIGWTFFAARLGKLGERPVSRAWLYGTGFVLGVASLAPTVLSIAAGDVLGLRENGGFANDAIYFVFGVGLREEMSKLLLFAPLLPFTRRHGTKLDVLVCGAMVGLGFGAVENVHYLIEDDVRTGIARFVQSNFFHMAMTGALAGALEDLWRERRVVQFVRSVGTVVVAHGAYDFVLTHFGVVGDFFALIICLFIMRGFLDRANAARQEVDRGITPLHAFILALVVVTGVSFTHAVDVVGIRGAPWAMAEGLASVVVMVVAFVLMLSGV